MILAKKRTCSDLFFHNFSKNSNSCDCSDFEQNFENNPTKYFKKQINSFNFLTNLRNLNNFSTNNNCLLEKEDKLIFDEDLKNPFKLNSIYNDYNIYLRSFLYCLADFYIRSNKEIKSQIKKELRNCKESLKNAFERLIKNCGIKSFQNFCHKNESFNRSFEMELEEPILKNDGCYQLQVYNKNLNNFSSFEKKNLDNFDNCRMDIEEEILAKK